MILEVIGLALALCSVAAVVVPTLSGTHPNVIDRDRDRAVAHAIESALTVAGNEPTAAPTAADLCPLPTAA